MIETAPFTGFTADGYRFPMELEYNNEKAFVEANRKRYYDGVRDPMRSLASALAETALDIDPDFNTRLTGVVSRLNRDTRFSKNKLPYRNHAWLCFKHHDESIGACFGLYFEIQPEGYGYGVGLYAPNTELMNGFRSRILAKPASFLQYAGRVEAAGMLLEGELFKRDRFKAEKEELKPYLNRKSIGWSFFSAALKRTMEPELKDDVEQAIKLIKPLYRLLCGLDQ